MKPFNQSILSVITPVYNNAPTLRALAGKVFEVTKPHFAAVEYIFVNDGSRDSSQNVLEDLARQDANIKVIRLARNFGQHSALMAGYRFANGDYIFQIDGDLEEPPEFILTLMEKIKEGFEIAHGTRETPRRSLLRNLATECFVGAYNMISDYPLVRNHANIRLMTAKYVSFILQFSEQPFLSGFSSWIGMKQAPVPFPWNDQGRTSSYTLRRLLSHARLGLISFSGKLMRVSFLVGAAITALSILYSIYVLLRKFLYNDLQLGFPTLIVFLAFLMGVQFILMGVLGEYVHEIFISVKKRPNYLILDTANIEP